jgi:hypothetical protein
MHLSLSPFRPAFSARWGEAEAPRGRCTTPTAWVAITVALARIAVRVLALLQGDAQACRPASPVHPDSARFRQEHPRTVVIPVVSFERFAA